MSFSLRFSSDASQTAGRRVAQDARRLQRTARNPAWACVLLAAAVCSACQKTPYEQALAKGTTAAPANEIRALWIVRDALLDPANIGRIIDSMQHYGLNTAVVQVRGRGDAYYRSSIEPRAVGLAPDYDPLQAFVEAARAADIDVHAWMNALFVADADTHNAPYLPSHLVTQHPEWILRDLSGRSLWQRQPEEWKELWSSGAFANPAIADVRAHTVRVVMDLLQRYAVDGIHLDYIRYPYSGWEPGKEQWGIDPQSLAPLSALLRIPAHELAADRRYDRVLSLYRAANVTALVAEISRAVRDKAPNMVLSAATLFSKPRIENNCFQDWPRWLRQGLIDYAFAMGYRGDFHERMEPLYDPAVIDRTVMGIGLHRDPPLDHVRTRIRASRALGAAGVSFFSHAWFFEHSEHSDDPYDLKALLGPARPSGLRVFPGNAESRAGSQQGRASQPEKLNSRL